MLKLSSIQGKLILLLAAYSALVIVSVAVTFWSLETQKQDALVINLAGRQRMLSQQMLREALQIGMGEGEAHKPVLQEASQTFHETLQALKNGGAAPYLPGSVVFLSPPGGAGFTGDAGFQAQLEEIETIWSDIRVQLAILMAEPAGSEAFRDAMQEVESLSPELVSQSDVAVRLIETVSTQKVTRLRWIQGIFLVSALGLLGAGAWMVRNSVIQPLANLGKVANRIGNGDLSTQVEKAGPDEVQALQGSFEGMRSQLLESQRETQAGTELLEQRVTQRTQELEALVSVSGEITSRLAIQDVFLSITQKTKELLNADVVFLCLLNQNGQAMDLHAASGPENAIVQCSSPVFASTVGKVLDSAQGMRCGLRQEQECQGFCQILAGSYQTSHLAAPLTIECQVIGALCVSSEQPGKFGVEDVGRLSKLANIAAVALQNARLYDQAERLATSEERQRIAAEMHDGLAQTLSYAKLVVDQASFHLEKGQEERAVSMLEKAHSSLAQAIEDTRLAIASLQEQGPLQYTLQEQLVQLASELSEDGQKLEWIPGLQKPVLLSRQESDQVLRVVREACLNAQRHSQASQITLSLSQAGNDYAVTVEDDGRGFNLDQPPGDNGRQHFGIKIMQARAARIGGRVEIHSTPDDGTRLRLFWPAREAVSQEAGG
jgi:two-component system nitrate/nitrite sensor histidine kinase NarX